ncbi:MAG TPA: tyrosine-type recombinase/integrase [Candidatus Sulfotelmatobacter sp.]
MQKRTVQSKLTIYRRHADSCKNEKLDGCECPLWVHGKVRGKFMQRSLGTRSLGVAEMKRDEYLVGRPEDDDDPTPGDGIRLLGRTPKGAHVSIEAAARDFLESKGRKSTNTKKLYKLAVTHFKQFVEAHGLVYLKQVETAHIRAYFEEFGSEWNSTTAESKLTHLRVWFNYCAKPSRRWIDFSPAAEPDLIQNDGTGVDRVPLTPVQVTQLLAAVNLMPPELQDRARALILLMLYTGMRISDATFCEREYLTERNTMLYWVIKTRRRIKLAPEISEQKVLDALAKLPRSRVYFFQPDVADDYREARQALHKFRKEFGSLMPGYEARVRETTKLVETAFALAGIEGSCHTLRDTFAINMLVGNGEKSADIYTVSKMLGHSDVKITDDHYVKLIPGYAELMSKATRVLAYQFPLAG